MSKYNSYFSFEDRHIGPSKKEIEEMLDVINLGSVDELISKTIPTQIRNESRMGLGTILSEDEYLKKITTIANKNKLYKDYIGMGYYTTLTPSVILRNILENPGWYTQYTPYQAEISQGRLEALLNFQTVVSDLTAMPLANASLLDEATSAAEAMLMLYSSRKKDKKSSNKFLVSDKCFPQTIDVLKTRSKPIGIDLVITDDIQSKLDDSVFGILVQYPDDNGSIQDNSKLFSIAKEKNIFCAVAADLLSLALLVPPGEFGADVVVGSTQRFGVPVGFGGPHAAYFATKENFKRQMPGRIIGVSQDSNDNRALRMALQTREQHIKREKATSNICTAQVLLAIMAGMYAVYHGPKGIKSIAQKTHSLAGLLNNSIQKLGLEQLNKQFFDTLKINFGSSSNQNKVKEIAEKNKVNFRYFNDYSVGISIGEDTSIDDIKAIVEILSEYQNQQVEIDPDNVSTQIAEGNLRKSPYLTNEVFNSYHSETEMMRYIKSLENKDLSLTRSMIPLGSCTMKLNAASEMFPISNPLFGNLHPFAPKNQTEGYQQLINEFEEQLCKITGFSAVSFQPNSGAQGEYTGLMVIKAYLADKNEAHRNIMLIPSSAHGTNPASAVMAGCKVLIVGCDEKGNIDVNDLKEKAEENKENLAGLMVTYPSTHGVFEDKILDICNIIHENGGLVYMDGANMNAQVGFTSPNRIGADVCHLNLHKTFCIPHGGGGPGVGPIAVAEHLVPFLPGHSVVHSGNEKALTAVSAAPWGSASILPISYGYVSMMGDEGLEKATSIAILNANYIKEKLKDYYPVVYTGETGFVGHELIFDCRDFKNSTGVEVEDISKRLMDYGFHAPTISFPVHGTMMVEPTESESKAELDRFIEALISIRKEISDIADGKSDREDNVLINAPHTLEEITVENWEHPYTRVQAVFPLDWIRNNKFWPTTAKVNNAYGDRNLVCTCYPFENDK